MPTANRCRCFAIAKRTLPLLALAGLWGCQGFPVGRGERVQTSAKHSIALDAAKPSADPAPATSVAGKAMVGNRDESFEPTNLPDLPAMPEPAPKPAETPLLDSAFDGSNSFRRLLLDHLDVPSAKLVAPKPDDSKPKTDPPPKSDTAGETPVPILETPPAEPTVTPKDEKKPAGDEPSSESSRHSGTTETPDSNPAISTKDESVERAETPSEPSFEIGELKICRRSSKFRRLRRDRTLGSRRLADHRLLRTRRPPLLVDRFSLPIARPGDA